MKRLVILGAGESGTGAALLAKQKGYAVFVSDINTIQKKYLKILSNNNIDCESGKHTENAVLNADEIVKSPGIPNDTDIIVKAKEKNISIISEIEFAARFTKAKLIGISGTNGKTTTASMVYHLFKEAGKDVCLAGNIGNSFAMALSERDYDYFVLELSSFQLEDMFKTRLNVAILLNISPDHLDRYGHELKKYTDAKFRLLLNQTKEDAFIYWADDEIIIEEINKRVLKQELLAFSAKKIINQNGAYLKNNSTMHVNYNSDSFEMLVEEFSAKGTHNTLNAMASTIVAMRSQIRKEKIKESLANFVNVPHRLELVCKIRGVDYINDSKATNLNASWYALGRFKKPIIWLAGGIDKGNEYEQIKPLVKERVKAIICIGADNTKIKDAFSHIVKNIEECRTMESAVRNAYSISEPGDVVLLSPACSSFDFFENFEDRGNQFKEIVLNL